MAFRDTAFRYGTVTGWTDSYIDYVVIVGVIKLPAGTDLSISSFAGSHVWRCKFRFSGEKLQLLCIFHPPLILVDLHQGKYDE